MRIITATATAVPCTPADTPKITDWMQAWGSLAGVLMSTIAVVVTGLLLVHERRARREDRADAEAAQARLVVGSVTHGIVKPDDVSKLVWEVANHSAQPVFDVYLKVADRHPTLAAREIPPSEARGSQIRVRPEELGGVGRLDGDAVEIFFTDAMGARWRRTTNRQPVRLRGTGEPERRTPTDGPG